MSTFENLSFYQGFEADIVNGKKSITIRDAKANFYTIGQTVKAVTHEDSRLFAELKILSIEPVFFDALNESHAKQENMSLSVLKQTIREIYPDVHELYVIEFRLVD